MQRNTKHQQETKKQHTVPRFYLKAFTDTNDQLFVFDKVIEKRFRANISDVSQHRRFYDLPAECFGLEADTAYDPQFVEHNLAERESILSKALTEFLAEAKEEKPIDQHHRFSLAYFIALQTLRTPLVRTVMKEAWKRVKDHLAATEGPECVAPGSPIFKQLDVPEFGWVKSQAAVMLNPIVAAQIMDPLVERVWCIGINKTGRPFYTSDNPVVKYAHIDPPPGMGFGIGSPGVEVALPLTPEIILILWDGMALPEIANFDGQRLILDDVDIIFYNRLQVSGSERQVYCSTSDFALVEKMCRERPHLRDPNRQHVWIT